MGVEPSNGREGREEEEEIDDESLDDSSSRHKALMAVRLCVGVCVWERGACA